MIRNKNTQDRLYLSRDEENIYIDNCRIPQHHIEGIRFLYRQFKRKNLGVIINDRFSSGRKIQIVLFLKAIRPLLDKPILILCQEGGEHDWMDQFYTWSHLDDEVIIELINPAIRKMIIINTTVNLPVFCSREWSIVIVDGDKNLSAHQILKLPFKADFKIWNTRVNMRENLDTFAEIYKWLYPKEIFDKHYFIPNHDSAVDVIDKSILLDSFMEDIVLRRDDLNSSFEKYQRDKDMPPPKASTTTSTATTAAATTTVSKKNKDATGTKIKRSKTKTELTETESKPREPPTATVTKLIGETNEAYDNTEDFSIDNYKRKNSKDIGNLIDIGKESQFKIIEIGQSEDHSDLKLYYEPDSAVETVVNNLEEMDTLAFGNDTFINKVDATGIDNASTCVKKETVSEPAEVIMLITGDKNSLTTDTSRNSPDKAVTNSDKIEIDKNNDGESLLPFGKTEANLDSSKETSDSNIAEVTSKPARSSNNDSGSNKMNLDELNKEISDLDTKDNSEVTENLNNSQKVTDVQSTNIQNVNFNDELHKDVSERVTEQVANSRKRNNIDDKIKECEEKVSKKFKGSFLDSLF